MLPKTAKMHSKSQKYYLCKYGKMKLKTEYDGLREPSARPSVMRSRLRRHGQSGLLLPVPDKGQDGGG